jgi:hypothetical protein
MLVEFERLDTGSLDGQWTEKDKCGGFGGQKRLRIDIHLCRLLDALTSGVWVAGTQEGTVVSTPEVGAD